MVDAGSVKLIPELILTCCFLLGSIPFGILIARLFKVSDLTSKGSGNIGATNVSRVVGFWPAGFITFALDVGKGSAAVFLASPYALNLYSRFVSGGAYDSLAETLSSETLMWVAGLFAVLGHCFSPWLHFRGGKGVATGFGAVLLLSPWAALAGIVAFAFTFMNKRVGSLASLTGLTVVAVVHLIAYPRGLHLWAGAATMFVILIRHEANIDALLENHEKTF